MDDGRVEPQAGSPAPYGPLEEVFSGCAEFGEGRVAGGGLEAGDGPERRPGAGDGERVAAEALSHDGRVVAYAAVGLFVGQARKAGAVNAVLGDLDQLGGLLVGGLHEGE